jgi:hypothetical protein
LAYGKIYLRIDKDKKNKWQIKPFVVEHDSDFYLAPVRLRSVK